MKTDSVECGSFASPVNVYFILTGITGLGINVFPLYVIFKLQTQANRVGRDILIAALSIADILTLLVPVLINFDSKARCIAAYESSGRPWICEMFFLMFIWLKLSAMFLITMLNYSSYLALNVKRHYSDRPSIGDRLSNSFHRAKSRTSTARADEHFRSSIVIATLVIGIALVAFLFSSFPYLGLGPTGNGKNIHSNSTKISSKNHPIQFCHLEHISVPTKEREYTFLFAVLMSTAACLVLHIAHSILSYFSCCFWRENLREAQELDIQIISRNSDASGGLQAVQSVQSITDSYARMTFALGVAYYATWIPLMVVMGMLMSSCSFSDTFKEYCLAGTFSNPFIDPIIYALLVKQYRRGYVHLLRTIFDWIVYIPKGMLLIFSTKKTAQKSEINT